jgi:uncharacterized membrane protein AbrB (regulator of aidB expression)
MQKQDVSRGGMLVAAALALLGTVGHYWTSRSFYTHDDEWLLVFAVALLTLCASAVNFDPKRWLR